MPSRSTEPRSSTLVGRVATVAALAAVGGGLLAASAAVALADRAITAADARRLRGEAAEILAEVEKLDGDALAKAVAEETRELSRFGLRLALYRDGAFVGGDGSLPLRAEGCAIRASERDAHVCAERSGAWAAVVAADEARGLSGRAKGAIALVAAIVAAVIGTLASRALAGWALGPLARLRTRVGNAPLDEAVDLGADEGVREIDALRRTLRDLLDRRAEALRTARLFAAGAAHELRTPLTTLSGELELLVEEPLPDPMRERLDVLRASTARIAALVERLLMLARVGAAEGMRHDAVELGDVLDNLRRRLPEEAAARLTYEQRAPGVVRGDESLLAVLCDNIVGNALAHARPAAVRVVLDERDGEVLLDVIDDGPGVPETERARLFEPFQRGPGERTGTGLGLALVARIGRAHGGEAAFLDAPSGAHLRVRLPRWTPRGAVPAREEYPSAPT